MDHINTLRMYANIYPSIVFVGIIGFTTACVYTAIVMARLIFKSNPAIVGMALLFVWCEFIAVIFMYIAIKCIINKIKVRGTVQINMPSQAAFATVAHSGEYDEYTDDMV